jgi:hypothetical protein
MQYVASSTKDNITKEVVGTDGDVAVKCPHCSQDAVKPVDLVGKYSQTGVDCMCGARLYAIVTSH